MNKLGHWLLLAASVFAAVLNARAQGAFQNLDFESATVPVVPNGQSGGSVAIAAGLPGWTAYYGTNQSAQVTHNDVSLGAVNISILGPNWGNTAGISIIEGNFSAVIQAGLNGNIISAAISQTGLVPVSTKSIQMKIQPVAAHSSTSLLGVTLGGQDIAMVPLLTTANYTLFGGDISAFAGQMDELRITAETSSGFLFNSLEVDSIVFSPTPTPEPGTCALIFCGAALFGLRRWRRRA